MSDIDKELASWFSVSGLQRIFSFFRHSTVMISHADSAVRGK